MIWSEKTGQVSWTVGNISEFGALSAVALGTATVDSTAGSFGGVAVQFLALSPTTYLLCRGGGGGGGSVVANLSGTTVSFGTEAGVMASNYMLSASDISPSTVLVMSANVGTSVAYPAAMVLTISGSVATVGPTVNLGTSSQTGFTSGCAALTNNLALAIWVSGSHVCSEVITMSGTALTPNTIYNLDTVLYASNSYTPSVSALGSTSALVVGMSSSSSMAAVVLTISGTVVSTGTALTGIDTSCTLNSVDSLGGNQYLVTYTNGANIKMVVLTVSGTVVTAGIPVIVGAGTLGNSVLQSAQGYTGYCYYCTTSTGYYAVPFTVNGSAISINGSATQIVSASSSNSNNVGVFNIGSAGAALLFGVNASNFPFGQTLEFVK